MRLVTAARHALNLLGLGGGEYDGHEAFPCDPDAAVAALGISGERWPRAVEAIRAAIEAAFTGPETPA